MGFDHSVCDKGSLWRDPMESMELSSCQSRDPQSQAGESGDHRSLWKNTDKQKQVKFHSRFRFSIKPSYKRLMNSIIFRINDEDR